MSADISILLIDDELPLLRLMKAFLERIGYQIESFESGSDALKRFEADPGRFRVLVTDLSLADIPGQELAMTMARLNPLLRVLLCSGYPFAIESLPADVRWRFAMLEKPFLPKMLTEAVSDLLNRKPSA